MKILNNFLNSVMAGIVVALGGLFFLTTENSIIGSLFFTLGLFLVIVRGYNLYTGKIAYIPDNKPSYLGYMGIMWIGNLVGTAIVSFLISFTRISFLQEKAAKITATKLSQSPVSAFILAVFCGVAIYYAVENFKNNSHEIGKYLGLLFFIPLFIICGFEHCIANMFYFIFSKTFSVKALLYLLIITLGNSVGSILLRYGRKALDKIAK